MMTHYLYIHALLGLGQLIRGNRGVIILLVNFALEVQLNTYAFTKSLVLEYIYEQKLHVPT